MSALKFLTKVSGLDTLVSALTSSSGVSDANKVIATNSAGEIDATFLPAGVELSVKTLPTSENLAAGDFVNIYNATGTSTARLADGSDDKPAHGFVLAGTTSPANATVYIGKGKNNQLTGLTPGVRYFLSATNPGEPTATAPAETSGNITQILGFAVSATELVFEYDDPVYIA